MKEEQNEENQQYHHVIYQLEQSASYCSKNKFHEISVLQ